MSVKRGRHNEGGPYAEGVRECVLRKVFGCKREDVTGKWRKLRNEKRQDCFPSLQSSIRVITSRDEIGGACGTYICGEENLDERDAWKTWT